MSTSAVAMSLPMALGETRVAHSKRASEARPPPELAERAGPTTEPGQMSSSSHENENDLGQITGIGPAVQSILTEHDLNDCADLVDWTPSELAELLKAKIPSMSAKRIDRENWIGQAQMRARHQKEKASLKSGADNTDEPPQETHTDDPVKATRQNWREGADFFVSFGFAIDPQGEESQKTRVYYSQADRPKEWDGIATDQLVNWMLRQADLPLPPGLPAEEAEANTSTVFVTAYDLQTEILEVQLFEAPASPGVRQKTLKAQVRLRISGPDAETMARGQQIPFQINVYTVDLEDATSTEVASTSGQLELPETEHTQHIVFPVPELGRYELFSIAFMIPPGRLLGVYRGPVFNVVP